MTGWDDRHGRRTGRGSTWDEVASDDPSYDPQGVVQQDPWLEGGEVTGGAPVARRGEGRYSFQPPPPAYAQYPPPIYAHPYGYPPPYRRPVNPAIPIVGGVFSIVAGAGGVVWALSEVGANTIMWDLGLGWCAVVSIILGMIGVMGGILAMMKRLFLVALVGAICATLTFGWFGTSFFIGLVAVILIAIGKDAFDLHPTRPDRIRY